MRNTSSPIGFWLLIFRQESAERGFATSLNKLKNVANDGWNQNIFGARSLSKLDRNSLFLTNIVTCVKGKLTCACAGGRRRSHDRAACRFAALTFARRLRLLGPAAAFARARRPFVGERRVQVGQGAPERESLEIRSSSLGRRRLVPQSTFALGCNERRFPHGHLEKLVILHKFVQSVDILTFRELNNEFPEVHTELMQRPARVSVFPVRAIQNADRPRNLPHSFGAEISKIIDAEGKVR